MQDSQLQLSELGVFHKEWQALVALQSLEEWQALDGFADPGGVGGWADTYWRHDKCWRMGRYLLGVLQALEKLQVLEELQVQEELQVLEELQELEELEELQELDDRNQWRHFTYLGMAETGRIATGSAGIGGIIRGP